MAVWGVTIDCLFKTTEKFDSQDLTDRMLIYFFQYFSNLFLEVSSPHEIPKASENFLIHRGYLHRGRDVL